MSIDIRGFFPEELSDEAASQLINFFYNFALEFETIYLGQALRHEKSMISANYNPCEKNDIPDLPF